MSDLLGLRPPFGDRESRPGMWIALAPHGRRARVSEWVIPLAGAPSIPDENPARWTESREPRGFAPSEGARYPSLILLD